MAFRFDFAADDFEEHGASSQARDRTLDDSTTTGLPTSDDPAQSDCVEVSLDDLIEALPPVISYTPIRIPATRTDKPEVILPRRDLFDVRFQLLNNDDDDDDDYDDKDKPSTQRELEFADAPSDLIPGVYEGGLKSWECSIDLAAYLAHAVHFDGIRSKAVLEIGCGTALPTLSLLHKAFSLDVSPSLSRPTIFYLQDYNRSALELMTLPNIILTWCSYLSKRFGVAFTHVYDTTDFIDLSPAGRPHRPALSIVQEGKEQGAAATTSTVGEDTTKDRSELEVELTPELLAGFKSSLASLRIKLRFFHGSWADLATSFDTIIKQPLASDRDHDCDLPRSSPSPSQTREGRAPTFDVVLTSETIYRSQSLTSLLSLLYQASRSSHSHSPPASASVDSTSDAFCLCLVAAKAVYFGVGGSLKEFLGVLEGGDGWTKGHAEIVQHEDRGVARRIMLINWHNTTSS